MQFRVEVGIDGKVDDIEIIKAISLAFRQATLPAAAGFLFKPMVRAGKPQKGWSGIYQHNYDFADWRQSLNMGWGSLGDLTWKGV